MPAKRIEENILNKDESFQFHCTQCGDCCRHREDILISPYDLGRLSQGLNMSRLNVLKAYCETYIGKNSHLPVVRLLPAGKLRACPFLRQNRCTVHAFKPTVCALYPLGRIAIVDFERETEQIGYILNRVVCGTKSETHTVRQWVGDFNLEESEEFFQKWQQTVTAISTLIHQLEEKVPSNGMQTIWSNLFSALYLEYSPDKDFLKQFTENADQSIAAIQSVCKQIQQIHAEAHGKEDIHGAEND